MSRGIEKMLRQMIAPNADVRYTASDAMDDPYWTNKEPSRSTHRTSITTSFDRHIDVCGGAGKSASLSQAALSAMSIDMDTSKLLDIVSPFTTRTLRDKKEPNDNSHNKENVVSPSLSRKVNNTPIKMRQEQSPTVSSRAKQVRSQLQPKSQLPKGMHPSPRSPLCH